MKMSHVSLVAVILCGALLIPQLATAQKVPDVEDTFIPGGGGTTIPDDAYDGSLASMLCFTTAVGAGTVTNVDVDLAVDHTWVGDLTVKVASPMGTIVTVMSRPGEDEAADDGSDGGFGDSSNLVNTSPIIYLDTGSFDAETMGALLDGAGFVCQDDGECDFFPNPGAGPGVNLADFNGEAAGGDWQVCVGDSASGDVGQLFTATANVTVAVPTVGRAGLLILLLLLTTGSFFIFRR